MNALSSILSYIQRPTSIRTLEGMGISMFTDEAKTQFRNVLEIFKDIAVNWNTMSTDIQDGFVQAADDAGLFNEELAAALGTQEQWNDLQKRDIAQASAGVYRRNYLIALIERLSDVQGVLNNLMDAEGHSMRENIETMEALDKKQISLKTSAQALAVAAGDAGLADAFKALAMGGAKALDVLNNLPPGMKDVVLATITLFTAVKALEMGMKVFGLKTPFVLQAITDGIGGLKGAFLSLQSGITAAKDASIGFLSANLPLLALSAIIGGIMAWRNAVKAHREEQEKAIEVAKERVEALKEEREGLQELANEFDALKSRERDLSITFEEKTRLRDIQRKLVDLYGVSITGIDEEGRAYSDSTEVIRDRVAALEEMLEAEEKSFELAVIAEDDENLKTIQKNLGKYEELADQMKGITEDIQEYQRLIREGGLLEIPSESIYDPTPFVVDADTEKGKKALEDYIQTLSKAYRRLETEFDEVGERLTAASGKRAKLLQADAINMAKAMTESGKTISDSTRAAMVDMAGSMAMSSKGILVVRKDLEDLMDSVISVGLDEAIQDYNDALYEGDPEVIDQTSEAVGKLVRQLAIGRPELADWIVKMDKLYPSSAQMAATTFNLADALENLNKTTRDNVSDLEMLNKTIQDVRNGQALSAKTVLDLMEKYELSAEQIKEVAGGYTVEIGVLEDLKKAKITTFEVGAEAEQRTAEIVKKNVEARIRAYGLEIDQLNNTMDARAAMLEMAEGKASGRARATVSGFNIQDEQRELEQYAELSRWFYKEEVDTASALSSEYEKASADLEKYQQNQ